MKNHSLHNVSVKNKLILIYLICVIIPIGSLVFVFYHVVDNQVRDRQIRLMQASAQRIRIDVANSLEISKVMSDTLLLDEDLHRQLTTRYPDLFTSFRTSRQALDRKLLPFFNTNRSLMDLTIYHTNPSMFSGGFIKQLDDAVRRQDWYARYLRAPDRISLFAQPHGNKIVLSMIRALSQGPSEIQMILKMDVLSDTLERLMKDPLLADGGGNALLLNPQGQIVAAMAPLASIPAATGLPQYDRSRYAQDHHVIEQSFGNGSYLAGWKLAVVLPETELSLEMRKNQLFLFTLMLASLFFASVFIYLLARSITVRLHLLTRHMSKAGDHTMEMIPGRIYQDEIGIASATYNDMIEKISELLDDMYQTGLRHNRLELEKATAELQALHSQVNPHFLYNILNTVQAKLLLKKDTETAAVVKTLSRLFRRQITKVNDLVTVKEELDLVTDYLHIQQYRFEDKLSFSIDVRDNCLGERIPKMCIQTLVENASIHGVEKMKDHGHISIQANRDGPLLLIQVQDNGAGIPEERLQAILHALEDNRPISDSTGLLNLYRRLRIYYGTGCRLTLVSTCDAGTVATIALPLEDPNTAR